MEAVVAGEEEAAAVEERYGAEAAGGDGVPGAAAGCGIVAPEGRLQHVDPPEAAGAVAPERAFAEAVRGRVEDVHRAPHSLQFAGTVPITTPLPSLTSIMKPARDISPVSSQQVSRRMLGYSAALRQQAVHLLARISPGRTRRRAR